MPVRVISGVFLVIVYSFNFHPSGNLPFSLIILNRVSEIEEQNMTSPATRRGLPVADFSLIKAEDSTFITASLKEKHALTKVYGSAILVS